MADPFEVRIKFTHHLQHLNATQNSAQKAAHYALKHKSMDEDLHSCILEQLERNNMNNRANIMFFLEQLCDASQRENAPQFVDFIRRDILRIVDAVAPAKGGGGGNVKVVRRVLGGLVARGVLGVEMEGRIEGILSERDTQGELEQDDARRPLEENTSRANGFAKPDKKQVEQRIEEDRERHKRLRESQWAVSGEGREETDAIWDDASDVGDDDFEIAKEEAAERSIAVRSALDDIA